jgi:hypothetical protein
MLVSALAPAMNGQHNKMKLAAAQLQKLLLGLLRLPVGIKNKFEKRGRPSLEKSMCICTADQRNEPNPNGHRNM